MSTAYSAASVIIPAQGGGGKADTLYGWRPDVNQLQDFTVQRNTAASRVNEAGLIEFVGVNEPRFDWGEGGSCPSLLVEPERMNLLFRSEEFDNASWLKAQQGTGLSPVVTPNTAVAPDGTMTADSIVFNRGAGTTSSDVSSLRQSISVVNGQAYSGSFYIKAATAGDVGKQLLFRHAAAAAFQTITLTADYVRLNSVETPAFTGSATFDLRNVGTLADAEVSVFLWGAQLEEGSYPTSYIKTEGSQVTRNADVISKTGIASLIGQSEGTIYMEVNVNKQVDLGGAGPNGIEISNGSTSGIYLGLGYTLPMKFSLSIRNAGSFSVLASTTNSALGTYKMAVGYSSAGFVLYLNGVQIGTSATLPPAVTYSALGLSSFGLLPTPQGELYNQALLYKTRLTNDELAALTTL